MIRGQRRALIACVVAVAVTIVGAGVFWAVGGPSVTSLQDHPDPSIPGTIAYSVDRDGGQHSCIYVLPASGASPPKTVACGGPVMTVRWAASNVLVTAASDPDARYDITVYDVDTGAVRERFKTSSLAMTGSGVPEDQRLEVSSEDGRITVDKFLIKGADPLLSVKPPYGSDWVEVTPSPDNRWVLARDDRGRLLVSGIGSNKARILVGGRFTNPDFSGDFVGSIAWFQPGQTQSVVDLNELRNAK